MSFYTIFWDGVGYGKPNPQENPFFSASLPTLSKLCNSALPSLENLHIHTEKLSTTPVDANLDIDGLPQSGTGQTSLFSGVNAAKIFGKHFGPYPPTQLHSIIKEKNLFQQLREQNKKSFFANAYPQKYFDYIFSSRGKIPTVAFSYLSAQYSLNTHKELSEQNAISGGCNNDHWKIMGYDVPTITTFEAGKNFYGFGKKYDYVFFEYFFTDKAGHSQNMKEAIYALEIMDNFLEGIFSVFDEKNDTLIFISDHGNIEDLTTKSHTRNPVPLIVIGKGKEYFSNAVKSLVDFTPAVVEFLTK